MRIDDSGEAASYAWKPKFPQISAISSARNGPEHRETPLRRGLRGTTIPAETGMRRVRAGRDVSMPELRQNRYTKEWVVLATERAKRPEELVVKREHKTLP